MTRINDLATTFENASLEQAIEKLQELKDRRRDIILPIDSIRMNDSGRLVVSDVHVGGLLEPVVATPNEIASRHISSRLDIPWKYWQRMSETMPELAAQNFNAWAQYEAIDKGDKRRRFFLRTYMDEPGGHIGTARALLSNKYLPVDNLSLVAMTLRTAEQITRERGVRIIVDRCDLSETKMYLRFRSPDIANDGPSILRQYRDPNNGSTGGFGGGQGIVSGFVITNSEVGYGSLSISPVAIIGACNNGLIWKDESYDRRHLGAKMEEGIYQDDTRQANVELILKQIRDHLLHFLSEEYLGQRINDIQAMADRKISHPVQFIQNVGQEISLSDTEVDGILDHFMRQGTAGSVFDAAQAMTSFAQVGVSADRRYDLEHMATDLLRYADKCDEIRTK